MTDQEIVELWQKPADPDRAFTAIGMIEDALEILHETMHSRQVAHTLRLNAGRLEKAEQTLTDIVNYVYPLTASAAE